MKYCRHKIIACFSCYLKTLDQSKSLCGMSGMMTRLPGVCSIGSSDTLFWRGGGEVIFFASAFFNLHKKNIRWNPYGENHVFWRKDCNGRITSLSFALTMDCCAMSNERNLKTKGSWPLSSTLLHLQG